MPAGIVGEVTADRSRLILMGTGPEWAQAQAARDLELLTPTIKATDPPGALSLPLSWPACVQLAATYGPAWEPQPNLVAWLTEQVMARTAPVMPLNYRPPAGLVPRSYQAAGAHLIAQTGSALIFDEPRTGKTITAILGLVERAHLQRSAECVLPILVICPASVVDPWVEHFQAWAPGWRAVAWRGTPDQRRRLIGTADIYVCSFDTARNDAPATGKVKPGAPSLIKLAPRSVVIDECHKIKNQSTKQTASVRRIAAKAENVIALSGTPITHHPANLWPTLTCLDPVAWPSRERWVARYCRTGFSDYGESILGLNAYTEPEFRDALLGQERRVARADVIDEMPKVYSIRTVELPSQYRKAYDEFEADMLAELPDDGGELEVMSVLAQLNFLTALASSACDVEIEIEVVWDDELGEEVERKHTHVHPKAPSWKVDALLEICEERPGDNVLVFAPSKRLIMLAGQAAEDAGLKVGYVVGGQKPADRTATVRAFQAGELDLLCATTGAGGTGLTFSAAGTVVFLARPWSLVDSIQAEDRAEGDATKTRGTEVIDIVASNTVDTRVRAVLRERAGQLADLVKDPRIVAELLGGASVTRIKRKAS